MMLSFSFGGLYMTEKQSEALYAVGQRRQKLKSSIRDLQSQIETTEELLTETLNSIKIWREDAGEVDRKALSRCSHNVGELGDALVNLTLRKRELAELDQKIQSFGLAD